MLRTTPGGHSLAKGLRRRLESGLAPKSLSKFRQAPFVCFLISTMETESSTMYCQGPQLACLSRPSGLSTLRSGRLQAPACLRKRSPVTDRWLRELEPAKGLAAARAQRAAGGWAGGSCRVGATGGQVGGGKEGREPGTRAPAGVTGCW